MQAYKPVHMAVVEVRVGLVGSGYQRSDDVTLISAFAG